jgi:3-isopropylmalate dehydrogenase
MELVHKAFGNGLYLFTTRSDIPDDWLCCHISTFRFFSFYLPYPIFQNTRIMKDRIDIRDIFENKQPPGYHDSHFIGILPGEGIGPQIIDICLKLLDTIQECTPFRFKLEFGGAIGKEALAKTGAALTEDVRLFCDLVFERRGTVFCGPGGDRFVYDLRKEFDLFCKLTPIYRLPSLKEVGVVKPEVSDSVDILVVRENCAGVYQGEYGVEEVGAEEEAWHRFMYNKSQVVDIMETAAKAALGRNRKVSVITKPGGVPTVSALWDRVAREILTSHGISMEILEIDNACYQVISRPRDFDVVVAPNLLGDIVSDVASLLMGSRGLSHSANFSKDLRCAVYQTGHGAAHDLKGKDVANPIGQILSLSMMLEQSFGLDSIAQKVRNAVEDVLAENHRTRDIATEDSHVVGTEEMGRRIDDRLRTHLRQ